MKTLYLRIGADKAGTVSITNLTMRNQDVFSQYGFYAFPRNCVHIFELIRNKNGLNAVNNFNDLNEKRRIVAKEFLADNEYGEYHGKNILLVTETLWGRLTKKNLEPIHAQVRKFLHSIRETFPSHTIKVVLQIRRIDLYIESLCKQGIKAGKSTKLKNLQQRVTADRAFLFFRMLEEVFGSENLIVRPFERSQLYNGCVVEDMLHTMGLSDHIEEFEITHGNEGLHRDLMETLVIMNQRYGKITPNDRLLQISSRLSKEFGFEDTKNLLDRETRKELLAQYAEFYSYLGQNYGDGGSFFKDPLPDDSHLTYKLDPEREQFIKQLVLEQADTDISTL